MRKLGLFGFSAILFVVFGVHAGDDEAQKKEKAALQGKWKIASLETNKGKDTNIEGAILEFDKDGKNLTFTHKDQTKKGMFTLNPAAKPKEIDIKPGDEDKGFVGIYQLEKDALKLCLSHDANDGRPGEFGLKDGKDFVLIMLERVK